MAVAGRRRVWCESRELAWLAADPVLAALATREIELIAAVFPWSEEQVPGLLEACERRRVRVSLWPMLDDAAGRWANTATLVAHSAMVRRLLARADGRPLASIFVDLEPPIAQVRAALSLSPRAARVPRPRPAEALAALASVADEARARAVPLEAAAVPLAALSPPASRGWLGALGVPLGPVDWGAIHLMAYGSLFVGYGRGLVDEALAHELVALTAREGRRWLGARAAVSLGVVSGGALGDERPMASVATLRREVAAVRAEGIEDIALFDLLGARRRGPAEAWIDALVDEPAGAPVRPSRRARAWLAACIGVGRALSLRDGTLLG